MKTITMRNAYRFTLLCLFLLAGIAQAEIETITYLHSDHLGSPVLARDNQGNTLWREDYSPWGERLIRPSGNSADIGYTGHYEETDIGLTYAQARWCDPQVGRFLAADAVDFTSGGAAHFNRYVYANNNPYIYTDPDGKEPLTVYIGSVLVTAHWSRNLFNKPFNRKAFRQREDISSTHRLGGQTDNLKWLSKDGHSEYVTAGEKGPVVTDEMNEGSYNVIPAATPDDGLAMKALKNTGHTITDVVPWVPLGNKPTDLSLKSNPVTRVWGLGKAGVSRGKAALKKVFGGQKNES